MTRRTWLLFGLSGLITIAVVAVASNWAFLWRLYTYGDYESLTVPVAWYQPVEKVAGSAHPLPWPDDDDQVLTDETVEAITAYAEEQNSAAVMVMYQGELHLREYVQDPWRETRFNPHSMSKTVGALLLGIALEEGHIPSIDTPIAPWVPEWAGDPRGDITLRQLLTMTGGLEVMSPSNPPSIFSKGTRQRFGTDFDGHTLDVQLKDPPGTKFEYNNDENKLIGLIVERATGVRYAQYLSEKLWYPLGLGDAEMYLDRPGGAVLKSCCIFSQQIDWLRLGELMRNRGRYKDQQIVPTEWIDAMVEPSPAYTGYGFQIWVGDGDIEPVRPADAPKNYSWQSEPYAADDVYVFKGHGFQRVWVVPSEELVILRTGISWPEAWDESRIPNLVIRAIQSRRSVSGL